ncbi:MAG: putative phosphodiesterase [Sulfurimonas sp.]|jgi:predicted phosphodiesterase|uniref:metallophosphoesterase family protein n=1 Tax=Sulfurimonas sp. TaxID=2022749 RepID=UPI0039E2E65F
MTIAVFSDIHGNVYSLEKALKIMESLNPDKYLFLGDMAGYYYYQNESIELLNSLHNLISIKGNHDSYFLNSFNKADALKKLDLQYGKSYSMLSESINEKSMKFFNDLLPYEKNSLFEAYHGSPNNYLEEYIYPDTNFNFELNVPFIFLGHTHYPMCKKINDTFIINPGSIGQPRDFNHGSFTIVDLKDKKIENIRYEYNIGKLEKEVLALQDKEYLYNVLQRTK